MRNEVVTTVEIGVCHAAVSPGAFIASLGRIGVGVGVGGGVGARDGDAEGVGGGLGMGDTWRKVAKKLPREGGQHELGPLFLNMGQILPCEGGRHVLGLVAVSMLVRVAVTVLREVMAVASERSWLRGEGVSKTWGGSIAGLGGRMKVPTDCD